ncbi:MAG: hypothetical protein WCV63_03110 [Negativicutes bacterium]|jgi:hypothetical protein
MKQFGLSRKKIGKLHKEYYVKRLEKSGDADAFQKAIMATIKAMMDVMDVNNRQITADIKELLEKKHPEIATQIKDYLIENASSSEIATEDVIENDQKISDYYSRSELR